MNILIINKKKKKEMFKIDNEMGTKNNTILGLLFLSNNHRHARFGRSFSNAQRYKKQNDDMKNKTKTNAKK